MPEIDRGSPVPPYIQLAEILRAQIRSGELPAGARLPGLRSLRQEFDLAEFTVRKAVALLRDEGLVVTSRGMGTYVKR